MHAFKMLNFVFTLISLLVHIFLNPAMAPKENILVEQENGYISSDLFSTIIVP